MIISPDRYTHQPISPTLAASSTHSFQILPNLDLSHERITSIVNFSVFTLIGYTYSPNTEYGHHLYRVLGSCCGQIFSGCLNTQGVQRVLKMAQPPFSIQSHTQREVSRTGEYSCLLRNLQERSKHVPRTPATHQQAGAG